ncbi:hypothetical protein VTO42DRAFT_4020 [Malbranchea cinnamomea]
MSSNPDLTLFHYTFSPFAKRVVWYLNLRGIKYNQCLQPPIMPRPDLAALGVQYRRIPVLAIGRDLYCDSRLILQKLEERFPDGALGATDNDGKALEKLLEVWTTDVVFGRAAQLIPSDTPLTSDPKFIEDRRDFFNTPNQEKYGALQRRPEATLHVKQAFHFLETTLLADGRTWIRKTDKPSLADIHASWVLDWVIGLKGAADPDQISERHFPKVFAWVQRFREVLNASRAHTPKPRTVTGAEVLASLASAGYGEPEGLLDETDPLKLRKGQEVVVWPTDSGSSYRDRGSLVALNRNEVVLQRKTANGQFDVRIHFPRINFRIIATEDASRSKI